MCDLRSQIVLIYFFLVDTLHMLEKLTTWHDCYSPDFLCCSVLFVIVLSINFITWMVNIYLVFRGICAPFELLGHVSRSLPFHLPHILFFSVPFPSFFLGLSPLVNKGLGNAASSYSGIPEKTHWPSILGHSGYWPEKTFGSMLERKLMQFCYTNPHV